MKFYTVRLKMFPEKYIGKQDPTYAINTDATIDWRVKDDCERSCEGSLERAIQPNAHWFVPEKRAKVWNDAAMLKRFFGYAGYNEEKEEKTFDAYEVVIYGDNPQTISGTEFYKNWQKYR